MNNEYNYILFLARIFGSFLTLIPLLARLIILSILLILSKKLVPIRANSWLNQNMKTNPKRTQTNPIFWRSIFDSSEKTRILEDFRQTFLCKTNPIYNNERWSMTYQKTLNMQNEPNLNIFLIS